MNVKQRCVLYVFDGLMEEQADDPAVMPRLAAFRRKSARMRQHRPIFPSVTRGNSASIATGCFPGTHGFHANMLLLSDLDMDKPTEANQKSLARLYDTAGQAMLAPTLGQMLAPHGLQYWGLGSWTNGCAIMHHPPDDAPDGSTGAALHAQFSMPPTANETAALRFGPWPTAKPYPHEEDYHAGTMQMEHALRLATEWIIPEVDPAVLCLWTCEPDHVQHYSGIGSGNDEMTYILRKADAQFGGFLDWLDSSGRLEYTNVLAMSDHGHFTIKSPPAELQRSGAAGVDAIAFAKVLEKGLGLTAPQCVTADNAGGVMIYLEDPADIDRVATWLMAQHFVGPVVATEARGVPLPEGALPLHCLGMDGVRAPDVAFSFAWNDETNAWGQRGHNFQAGKVNLAGGLVGLGTHGSLSPADMRACLACSGPAFRTDVDVTHATAHPDVVPTVLACLGLERPASVEGRPILDALRAPQAQHAKATSTFGDIVEQTFAASRRLPDGGMYAQAMVVAYEAGGPRVGRLVSAEFSHAQTQAKEKTPARL